MKWQDTIGKRFGRWSILADAGVTIYRKRLVHAKCKCGLEAVMRVQNLTSGESTQCRSCAKKGKRGNRKTHGFATKKPALYRIWRGIWYRCSNPKCKDWANYGGRGITVSSRWRGPDGFANFKADMGRRPSKKHSIDRIDVNGPYSPDNCRWATGKMQGGNKRKRGIAFHAYLAATLKG